MRNEAEMSPKHKGKKFTKDKKLIEDLIDVLILEQRQDEPSLPLDEYLAELKIKNRQSQIL